MPTAAKLVAALLMAGLGYAAAWVIEPRLPEATRTAYMAEIAAFFGLVVGWRFLGARAGRGWVNALGFGLTAAVLMTLISVFAFAFYEMIRRSLRLAYDGPVEALEDTVRIAVDYAVFPLAPDIAALLLIGGAVAGLIVEAAGRAWR